MRSFWLSRPDGRDATGAGCLLGIFSGVVMVLGFMVGIWVATSSGPIQLPAWIDQGWLNKDNAILKKLAIPVLLAPGVLFFWFGSRLLKRWGIEVWEKPDTGSRQDEEEDRPRKRSRPRNDDDDVDDVGLRNVPDIGPIAVTLLKWVKDQDDVGFRDVPGRGQDDDDDDEGAQRNKGVRLGFTDKRKRAET